MKKLSKKDLNYMKSVLIENVFEKYAMGETIDEDGDDELLYIKNGLNSYAECVEELVNTRDICSIYIQEQSAFLDPRGKFKFEEYNEKECESFRDYLVDEYGIERSLVD